MQLSEEAVAVLRRMSGEAESIGCAPDPRADCSGCRLVWAIRTQVLDPHDVELLAGLDPEVRT